jgi:hypothetical protein
MIVRNPGLPINRKERANEQANPNHCYHYRIRVRTYTYRDSEGRKTTISKDDIVQIMER